MNVWGAELIFCFDPLQKGPVKSAVGTLDLPTLLGSFS